ncbi:hypothetical protein ScPMuIL_006024 [Solemya velum]
MMNWGGGRKGLKQLARLFLCAFIVFSYMTPNTTSTVPGCPKTENCGTHLEMGDNRGGYTNKEGNRGDYVENVCKKYLSDTHSVLERQIDSRTPKVQYDQTVYSRYFRRNRNVNDVTCHQLFLGDGREIKHAMKSLKTSTRIDIETYVSLKDTRLCGDFIQQRGYIMDSLTEEEKDFPLAFGILVHDEDVELVERLLRAIYRPQNFYIIHVDAKMHSEERAALEAIIGCFSNVFLASRSIRVTWSSFQVLEAEMVCMRDMWRHQAWKYYINLAGHEFPLRTNYELVRILRDMDGANFVQSTVHRAEPDRWAGAPPIPDRLTPVLGDSHVAVTRAFVDFALHNETAIDLYNWCRYINYPRRRDPDDDFMKPHLSRFEVWEGMPFSCDKFIRHVCILGMNQLPVLSRRPEFFASKFSLDHDPYAYDCMEELLYNRTRHQYLHDRSVNTCYYSSLWQYKYRVPGH